MPEQPRGPAYATALAPGLSATKAQKQTLPARGIKMHQCIAMHRLKVIGPAHAFRVTILLSSRRIFPGGARLLFMLIQESQNLLPVKPKNKSEISLLSL
ncbi:hypothetical protein MHYP_G00224280 [Metynnis hypsauchen]